MSNEEFYNWWKKGGIESPTIHETGAAWKAWQARQPEIDALKEEVQRLRKDAERYQWLKDNALIDWAPSDGVALVIPEPTTNRNWKAETDTAIDAAMKETKTPRFDKTFCSSCGGEFGPADHGYSHCESHEGQRRIE